MKKILVIVLAALIGIIAWLNIRPCTDNDSYEDTMKVLEEDNISV